MQSLEAWTASEGQADDIVAQCAERFRASACHLLMLQLQRVGHLQSQMNSLVCSGFGCSPSGDLLPPVKRGVISCTDQRSHAIDLWARPIKAEGESFEAQT